MNLGSINWLSVVLAACAAFAIGGAWYSPMLLGRHWLEAAGLASEPASGPDRRNVMLCAFVATLIMSTAMAFLIQSPTVQAQSGFHTPSQQGAFYGMWVGLGWGFFAFMVVGLVEGRGWRYIAINGGCWIVAFTTMGGILGALH